MSTVFKNNYVYLDVKGYILKEKELYYKFSPPLFSWNLTKNTSTQQNLHWGCQTKEKPDRSFWLTEMHIVCGTKLDCHYIPGTNLKARKNSWSYNHIPHCWYKNHNKYTAHESELDQQVDVQEFLQRYISPGTIVFYKGGLLETFIADLCNATKSVNLEDLGFRKQIDFSSMPPITDYTCKVHKQKMQNCPSQEVRYFMKKKDIWLSIYERNYDEEWGSVWFPSGRELESD